MELKRIEYNGHLLPGQILTLVDEYVGSKDRKKVLAAKRYLVGNNPGIMDRECPDEDAPNNKIAVPYGRKIINTVAGYMYKPGLIRYTSQGDETYLATLQEVFATNKEPIKSARLGKDSSLYGVAYEYHYVEGVKTGDVTLPVVALPRFAALPVEEVIPLYDYEIEPKLRAFIRFYMRGEETHYFVYYERDWEHYRKTKTGAALEFVEASVHQYGRVPLNVYANNDEWLGDITPVLNLIDAYDVLVSDSLNEFDRFAWAYLLLVGFGLDDEDAKDIKWKRAFEKLESADAVKFLTKEINSEFITFLAEWIRKEIHNQSGVPDISDISFGSSASGTTIDKFIYLMELFTDPKEAYFRDALTERLKMIDGFLRVRDGNKVEGWKDIEITMDRNWPIDDLVNAQALEKYAGHVTEETLLSKFAPFIKNVAEEIEKLKKEKDENIARIQAQFDAQGGGDKDDKDGADPDGLNADA